MSLETAAGRALLKVPGVGRFLIQADGILTAPDAGADPASIAYFLSGQAQALRLQLQGVLVLRASAVRLPDGGAIVFCGVSTSGKSSVAAMLARRGAQVLADEWVPLGFDAQDGVQAMPFQPVCLLDSHALQQLDGAHRSDGARPVRPGLDKHAITLPACAWPSPVTELIELGLDDSRGLSSHPIAGMNRMQTLLDALHSPACLQASGQHAPGLHRLARLASSPLRMRRIVRPQVGIAVQDVAELVWAPEPRP